MEYYNFNQDDFNRWISDRGDSTKRLEYDLNSDSIIFDLGGFKGEWAESIHRLYGGNIFVFEPVKSFFDQIYDKFINNENIKVYHFGLGNVNESLDISVSNDTSSMFNVKTDAFEKIRIVNIESFLKTSNIDSIDLMKINIEGGEYDLLEFMIEKDLLKNIKNIQVQFHRFVEDCFNRRENIRKSLEKTHELTYDYEFVWENWKLK